MNVFTAVKNALSKVVGWVTSDKAKNALQTASALVEFALPVVVQINALAPNKTVTEVVAAYQKYGVPVSQAALSGNSVDIGNAMLNLATSVLSKNLPPEKAVASVSILQTAVQLAVLASKK